jgi:site-specific DNA-methyltransferase (adenine-specific)
MDFMRDIPDGYYELAICDPPYGINAPNMSAEPNQRRSGLQRLNGGGGKLKNRVLNTSKKIEWDYSIPNEKYFNELKRVSKNQIIWGGNYFPLPPSRCIICWDKMQPWENFSQIELAWTSFDMPAQIFKFDNRTGNKIHPTQKPVALYKYLLDKYAKPSDKILDTHGGSMSIAIACHDYGFDLDLCELDKEYFDKGVQRVKNHVAQTKLF